MISKLQSLFVQIVDRIERNPTPLWRYFLLFGAILALRLTLEFFSSHRLFTLDDIIHIGLWFLFIVLAFLLQLQFFSGVKLERIIKLVVVSFTIALSAPIIDLMISGGNGAKMNYLTINSWSDFWWNYFTAGGSSITRGATLGIRIEIGLLVIACFNYIRTKTDKIMRSILGAIVIYSVLVLSGSIPALLGFIVKSLHLQYQTNDQSTTLLLFSTDLALIFIAFLRYDLNKMRMILGSYQTSITLWNILLVVLGAGFAFRLYPDSWSLNPTTLFVFFLLPCLLICLSILQGYQTKKMRSSETIETRNFNITNGLGVICLIVAFAISDKVLFSVALIWGIQFMLYAAPLELAKVPILRNIFEGLGFAAMLLLGFESFGGIMVGLPKHILGGIIGLGIAFSLVEESSSNVRNSFPWFFEWNRNRQLGFRLLVAVMILLLPIALIAQIEIESQFFWTGILLSTLPAIHYLFRPNASQTTQILLILPVLPFLLDLWS